MLNVEIVPGAATASCRIGNGGHLAGFKVRIVLPRASVRMHTAVPVQGVLFLWVQRQIQLSCRYGWALKAVGDM